MGKWENGKMGKWENGKMGKWENGKIVHARTNNNSAKQYYGYVNCNDIFL
jgi:hypothetical protein